MRARVRASFTSLTLAAVLSAGLQPALAAKSVPSFLEQIGGGSAGQRVHVPIGCRCRPLRERLCGPTQATTRSRSTDRVGALVWRQGTRGRDAGRFENPRDVAFLNGKVYVADTGYNRVQVLDASTGRNRWTCGRPASARSSGSAPG